MISSSAEILQAALKLEAGELVVFPTETVYGLGADAENALAVAKIYALKGRPADHPVIVHVSPNVNIAHWANPVPPAAYALMEAFWPGPLTLIMQRRATIPSIVSGGQRTIGLRCPSHPMAQTLLKAFKGGRGGVAAPSANKFGRVSPTTAQHVRDEFGADPAISMILDGGQSDVGIESTILDITRISAYGSVLLRPGSISAEQIAEVLGCMPRNPDKNAPRASGTLESHYAPRTPVALVASNQLAVALARCRIARKRVALLSVVARIDDVMLSNVVAHHRVLNDPRAYAHVVYAALRKLDRVAADVIVIESPPQGDEWHGVHDRLRRAAHGFKTRLDYLW